MCAQIFRFLFGHSMTDARQAARVSLMVMATFLMPDANGGGRPAPANVTVTTSAMRYPATSQVDYRVSNAGVDALLVSCGIEARQGGKWEEWSADVHEPSRSHKERFRRLAPGSALVLSFLPTFALGRSGGERLDGGPYRLACRYRPEHQDPIVPPMIARSLPFLVMP